MNRHIKILTKIAAGWKLFKQAVIDNYNQDKRKFLEEVLAVSFSGAITLGFLFWFIVPFPTAAQMSPHLTPVQNLQTITPVLLHAFAALGLVSFFQIEAQWIKAFLHLLVSFLIKIRQIYLRLKFQRIDEKRMQ